MIDPSDFPTAEDVEAACDFVTACARELLQPMESCPDAQTSAWTRLVLETAWKIRGNRLRRTDYDRAAGASTGAEDSAG